MDAGVIVIRADGGEKIGGGHVFRSSVLGSSLLKAGFRVVFATVRETLRFTSFLPELGFEIVELPEDPSLELGALMERVGPVDVFVLDHYQRGCDYERNLRDLAGKLVVFDDYPHRVHHCDLLLDPTYQRQASDYDGLLETPARVLCGPQYALLRPQFAEARDRTSRIPRTGLSSVLITLGASDPFGLTDWVLQELRELSHPLDITLVLGANLRATDYQGLNVGAGRLRVLQNVSDMAVLVEASDFGIGTAGSTSWERCCLGLPSVIVTVAENQKAIGFGLEKDGAARHLGCFPDLVPGRLLEILGEFYSQPNRLKEMSLKAAEICDGNGCSRVVDEIKRLL